MMCWVSIINLDQIQKYIVSKRINLKDSITLDLLKKNKILKNKVSKIKLLGKGDLKDKINIEVNFVSKSAKEKIEKSGGKIQLLSKQ